MSFVPAMSHIARMDAQTIFTYRVNFGLHLLGRLLQIYLLKVVWTAVYGGQSAVDGVALSMLIAYLTLANLQTWFIYPEVVDVLPSRVRSGAVALDLARPLGLLPQLIARSVGRTAGVSAMVVVALPIVALVGSLQLPATADAAALYLVSTVFAYAITLAIGILLALVSFWTLEINGIGLLYLFVNQFFAGALIPLWFFPDWLRTVAELLPFQTQAFLPLSLYFGRLQGGDAQRALGIEVFWCVVLWVAAIAVWERTIRRIHIQGG